MIAHNFPPYSDASAVTLAKRIAERGEVVDVIAKDFQDKRPYDPPLQNLTAPFLGWVYYAPGPVSWAKWGSFRDFTTKGLHAVDIRRAGSPYPEVYSRSMWAQSHILAAALIATGRAKYWEAEFSDPLLWTVEHTFRPSEKVPADALAKRLLASVAPRVGQLLRKRRTVFEWAQLLPFALADRLVFTNEQQLTTMLQDAPEWMRESVRERSVVSPHPSPPAEWVPEAPPKEPSRSSATLGFFGSFYINRGLGNLLEAWASLPNDQARRLSLHVHTANDFSRAVATATRLGLHHQVKQRPLLSYVDFLTECQRLDALLVTDTSSQGFPVINPFLPSKYSDYRATRTPILALTTPGSPLSQVEDIRWNVAMHDIDAVRSALMDIANEVRE